MQKIFFLLILTLLVHNSVDAQAPVIYSIDQKNATVDKIISIAGKNFGSSASDIKVFFGAAEGKLVSVNNHLIKAEVPAGATYSKISVTNISSRLTGYTSLPFYPSFDGNSFNATHLSKQSDFLEEDELFDICVCDFDGDGRNDVGTTNNSNLAKFTSITVYKNNSTPVNISFQAAFGTEFNVNRETRNISCGDLNGDGKPELLVSQGGNAAERIYVLKNISTGPGIFKFESAIILSLEDDGPTNGARRIAVEDLDGNGKPEIIVSNQNVKQLIVFSNESEDGMINFPVSSRLKIDVPGNTLGLTIQDLDGDFLPEIITGNNLSDNIYYLKNKSFPGSMVFEAPVTLNVPGLLVNLMAGDIDGDDKPDLAAADFNSGNLMILLNQSVKNSISFTSPQKVPVSVNPWGLDMGDINGDGKPDLAVSSLSANDKNIILLNNSSTGNISFQPFRVGNNEITRNIKIADLNGDAKPDLCFTAQKSSSEFYLSTLQNTACVFPEISPATPDPVCAGIPVMLSATRALHVTYQWQKNGVAIPGATGPTLEVSSAGDYSVTIVSSQDGCSQTSPEVEVTEKTEAIPSTPVILNSGAVCEGEQLQLSPASPMAGATYHWYGPNNFSYTGETLKIDPISLNQAGEYFLQAEMAGCKSDTAFTEVLVNQQPNYEIMATNGVLLCEGESTELIVSKKDDLQYQWYKNGEPIQNATTYNLNVTESGNYHANLSSSAGCSQNTSPTEVVVLAKPSASFAATAPKFCVNEEITFTNHTTFNNDYPVNYDWNFGDNTHSGLENPTHRYAIAGTFTVLLTATYENYVCGSSFEQDVEISDLPAVHIIANTDVICAGDSVLLKLAAADADDVFSSITWSDGNTADSIYVSREGEYQATVMNSAGCENSTQLNISKVPPPAISASVEKSDITSGESVMLQATGGISYVWTPADRLDDATLEDPVATPLATTTYTVVGTDINGCTGTDSVKINVERIVNITPKNMFSPNNDGIDDYWEISNIEDFPDCKIAVFNIQGRSVYESQPYLNNWNGSDRYGKPLDEGVYYYTIRCSNGNKNERAGSITLIR